MNTNEFDQTRKTRHLEPEVATKRIALPSRTTSTLFAGWGPRLLALALAAGALATWTPAKAATASDGLSCTTQAREATTLRAPLPDMPAIAQQQGYGGDVVLRIDLSPTGEIDNAFVAQSSGNPLLDREALRVTREARFAPTIVGCRAVADTVLYTVSFVP